MLKKLLKGGKKQKKPVKVDKNRAQIAERLDQGWLHAKVIVEVLGAPKEYVSKTLKQYTNKIKKEKGIEVLKLKISRPKETKKLFSTFADIEMLVKDASTLAFFCFDYMPSSIEVIDPTTFTYNAHDFSTFFNDLQARLHKLDMMVKNITAHNKNLLKNANLLLRNNMMIVLKEGEMDIEKLSKKVGIPKEQLEPFAEEIVQEGWIKKKGGKYSRDK